MKHFAIRAFGSFAFAFILLSPSGPALADPKAAASIPTADLMQPADLAVNLKSASAPKPLILQVGFRSLYMQAHIPDSEYVGAASEDAGLQGISARHGPHPVAQKFSSTSLPLQKTRKEFQAR